MTTRAKEILKEGINLYSAVPNYSKAGMIETVKANLKVHYNGLNTIGMGLEADKVVAGEIFLRIFKNNN